MTLICRPSLVGHYVFACSGFQFYWVKYNIYNSERGVKWNINHEWLKFFITSNTSKYYTSRNILLVILQSTSCYTPQLLSETALY